MNEKYMIEKYMNKNAERQILQRIISTYRKSSKARKSQVKTW